MEAIIVQYIKHIKILPGNAFNTPLTSLPVQGELPVLHLLGEENKVRTKIFSIAFNSICKAVRRGGGGSAHINNNNNKNNNNNNKNNNNNNNNNNKYDDNNNHHNNPRYLESSLHLEKSLGLAAGVISPLLFESQLVIVNRIISDVNHDIYENKTMTSTTDLEKFKKLYWNSIKICIFYKYQSQHFRCEMLLKTVVTIFRNYITHFTARNQYEIEQSGGDVLLEWPTGKYLFLI